MSVLRNRRVTLPRTLSPQGRAFSLLLCALPLVATGEAQVPVVAGARLVGHPTLVQNGLGSTDLTVGSDRLLELSVSEATPGLYRVEVFNPSVSWDQVNRPNGSGVHRFAQLESVEVLIPNGWQVQWAAEKEAQPMPPWMGFDHWSLVKGPTNRALRRQGEPSGQGAQLYPRLQGGQKATWIVGPANLVSGELPATTPDLSHPAAQFLKLAPGGTGYPRLDQAKLSIIRSDGPAMDDNNNGPETMAWWCYNSHVGSGALAPGGAPDPRGFQTWMHFGSTPGFDSSSRGGTNGRYEACLWMLENYLLDPVNHQDSYRMALQMARHQVTHGFVWGEEGAAPPWSDQARDAFSDMRRYERCSLDYPGDYKEPSHDHNWTADWWCVGSVSGDPLILKAAELATDRVAQHIIASHDAIAAGNCKLMLWKEALNSRIVAVYLRNLYAGWLVTGSPEYQMAAEYLIEDSYERLFRLIPVNNHNLYWLYNTGDALAGQPWHDLRIFSAHLDWIDMGVGLAYEAALYKMIRYSADYFTDSTPPLAMGGSGLASIAKSIDCEFQTSGLCIPDLIGSNQCLRPELDRWDQVLDGAPTAVPDYDGTTLNGAYGIYPYYRLAKEGAAVLGLSASEVQGYRDLTAGLARASYDYLGVYTWSTVLSLAANGATPPPLKFTSFPTNAIFKGWGRMLYGARPTVLQEVSTW